MPCTSDHLVEDALRDAFSWSAAGIEAPADMAGRVSRARRSQRRRAAGWAGLPVAGAVAATAVVTAYAPPWARHPAPGGPDRGGQGSAIGRTGDHQGTVVRVRLAGSYTFTLPRGFTAGGRACPALQLSGVSEALVSRRFSRTASAEGGCLSISLVAPPPPGGRPVKVGANQARLRIDGRQLILSVVAPSARGSRGIVLTATGLSAGELLTIARSGFASVHPDGPACTTVCG
jgi:hypothetical protein